MARYSASALTSAGSTTLPIMSLYGSASVRPRLRELHLFNATSTAVSLKLVRVTTAGTRGSAVTAMPEVAEDPAAVAATYQTHTVAPTITSGDLFRCVLGAAAGAGIMYTFPDQGIVIPMTANNGLAVVVSTGTGQTVECTFVWDE